MLRESELEADEMDAQMKYQLLLAQPEAYKEIYPTEADPAGATEGYGWAMPESPEDVQRILNDIKRLGVLD